MIPIAVQKEPTGYVLNGWLVPLVTAALSPVVNGVARAEDVDRTCMITHRGCPMGPLGMNRIGAVRRVTGLLR